MVGTRGAVKFSVRLLAAAKAIWKGGSPFTALTAVWPTNDEGKYVIEAEGIRLAFTNHGAALSNLWINDTNGQEIDIVLGLDHADLYTQTTSNPYLNGVIGMLFDYAAFPFHIYSEQTC
jgi:aldose 1-epimerase